MSTALEKIVKELIDNSKSPATRTERYKAHFERFVKSIEKYENALIKAAILSQLKAQPGHEPLNIPELIKHKDFNTSTVQQLLLDEKINTTQFLLLNQYIKIKAFRKEVELALGKSLFTFYEFLTKALLLIHDISQTDKAFIEISKIDPEAIQAYMIFNQYAQTCVTEVLYHATIEEARAEPEIAKKLQSLTEETIRLKPEADQHKKFDAVALAQEAVKQAYEKATKESDKTTTDTKVTVPQLLAEKIKETATSTGIVTPEQIAEVVIKNLIPQKLIIAFDKKTEEQLKVEILRLIFAEAKTGIIITAEFFKAFLEQCFPSTKSENKAIVDNQLEELQAFINKQREKHKQTVDNSTVLATDITSTTDNIAHVVGKIAEHKKDANIDEQGFARRSLEQELALVTQTGEHSPKVAEALAAIITSYDTFKALVKKEEELENKLSEAVNLFGDLAKIFLKTGDADSDSKKTAAIEKIVELFNQHLSVILNTEEPQQQQEKIAIISAQLVTIATDFSDNTQLKDCIEALNILLYELSTAKTSSHKSKLIGKFLGKLAGKFIDDSVSAASSAALTAFTGLFKRKPKEEKKDAAPATPTETKAETQDTSDQLEFYYQVLTQQQQILFEQLQLANIRAMAVLAHSADPKTIIITGDNSGFISMTWNFLQQLLPYKQLTGSYTSSPLPYQLEDQLQLLININIAIAELESILGTAKLSDMESITPAIKRSYEELEQKLTKLSENREELKSFLINMHLLIIQKQIQAIFERKVNKGLLIDPSDITYSNPKISDGEISKRKSDYAKFDELLAKKSLDDNFLNLLGELHLTANPEIAAETAKIHKILNALSGDKAKIDSALHKTPKQKIFKFEEVSLSITILSWLIKAGWNIVHFALNLYREIIKLILIIIRPIKFILNYLHRYIAKRRRRAHHASLITQLDAHLTDFSNNGNYTELDQETRNRVIFELKDIRSMVGGFGKANQLTSLRKRLEDLLKGTADLGKTIREAREKEAQAQPAAPSPLTPVMLAAEAVLPPSPTSPTSYSDKATTDAAKELIEATKTCGDKTGEEFKEELKNRLNAFLCNRQAEIAKNLTELEEKINAFRQEVNASADLTPELKAEKLAKLDKIQAQIAVLRNKSDLKLGEKANPHCLQSLEIASREIKKMNAKLEKIKIQRQVTVAPATLTAAVTAAAWEAPMPVQCATAAGAAAAAISYVVVDQISKTAQPWVDVVRTVVGYARGATPAQKEALKTEVEVTINSVSDSDDNQAPWYSTSRWMPRA